jgi:hypothetical protein
LLAIRDRLPYFAGMLLASLGEDRVGSVFR